MTKYCYKRLDELTEIIDNAWKKIQRITKNVFEVDDYHDVKKEVQLEMQKYKDAPWWSQYEKYLAKEEAEAQKRKEYWDRYEKENTVRN